MTGPLTGKVIVVTGSTRGIGRSIAEACAAAGADVIVSSRSEDAVHETVRSLDQVVDDFLARAQVSAIVVRLDGAVENAVRLGVADAVADVVATGGTLRQAGLETIGDPLLVSEALLIRRAGVGQDGEVATFVRRIQGVIAARTYVMVDYDIPAELVARACVITPGIESPTVSPLADARWSAVRAMVSREKVHHVMDELYELGARGIIVTDIHACRL